MAPSGMKRELSQVFDIRASNPIHVNNLRFGTDKDQYMVNKLNTTGNFQNGIEEEKVADFASERRTGRLQTNEMVF